MSESDSFLSFYIRRDTAGIRTIESFYHDVVQLQVVPQTFIYLS